MFEEGRTWWRRKWTKKEFGVKFYFLPLFPFRSLFSSSFSVVQISPASGEINELRLCLYGLMVSSSPGLLLLFSPCFSFREKKFLELPSHSPKLLPFSIYGNGVAG